MDATTRKLIEMHANYELEIAQLREKSEGVRKVLESLGSRSRHFDNVWDHSPSEIKYAKEKTFAEMTLVDTCKRILYDYPREVFTKGTIEYLAAMGGYPFATDDPKNSVDVTMRRLAKDRFCEVHRSRGPVGNRYCLTRQKFFEVTGGGYGPMLNAAFDQIEAEAKEEGANDAAPTKASAKGKTR